MSAEPLVAVVCRVPLLSEALKAALEGIATVHAFPAGRKDTGGLLQALEPHGVVVDSEAEADQATVFARSTQTTLVHISHDDRALRVFREGRWHEAGAIASPESVRNALVGGLFRRGERDRS